jgi:hypothetical protein
MERQMFLPLRRCSQHVIVLLFILATITCCVVFFTDIEAMKNLAAAGPSPPESPPQNSPTSPPTTPRVQEWTQMVFDSEGEAHGGWFGSHVVLASDGSRVAMGAPNNDRNGSEASQVRIYDWDGSQWAQVHFRSVGEAPGDLFGYSVALSSDGTLSLLYSS